MFRIKSHIFIFLFTFLFINNAFSKSNYFNEGKKCFENKKFSKSKFKFEQDIVFNPKNELSNLYLAKIFNEKEEYNLEEQNLNTVILINPKNEEAVFLLALLKIRQSNYSETEILIKNFKNICKTLCNKETELNKKLKNLQTQ